MADWALTTPVAFIIFNRPDTTERVFAEIARARPAKLLVIADGARAHRAGEADRCAASRAIIDRVDWKCDISTNYSDVNLGCKNRLASGIDWVFEQVPEAIILEDDCLPHPSFFRFCDELLDKYREDERVAQIGGSNFQMGRPRGTGSYYFSRYNHIWGWATWRRAWKHYDVTMRAWNTLAKEDWLAKVFAAHGQVEFWRTRFDMAAGQKIDTWDYQWNFAAWMNDLYTVTPNRNLISNIGFGPEATHTKRKGSLANMEVQGMDFPLVHPDRMDIDADADAFTAARCFSLGPFYKRIAKKVLAVLQAGA